MAAVLGRRRTHHLPARYGVVAVLLITAAFIAGCSKPNTYAPPPPASVGAATPLQQTVKLHLEQTGNTIAYNTVDLVARVEGFLTAQDYEDGAYVDKDKTLFIIEQPPYQAQLEQAKAALLGAQAELVKSQAEFDRQSTLRAQDVSSQVQLDKARAQRDTDKANVMSQQAAVQIAQINLSYTTVKAPFDGTVTRHLISVGEVVGGSTKTKLATIVQLDPIYVTFNLSEQELLKIRQNLGGHKVTLEELQKVPMEIGLMTETGFPYKGHLDYVSPEIDSQTGTILVRGIFKNPDHTLLPGFFVRIQIPTGKTEQNALLVPDRALGQNQAGRYLLVLNKDDVVEQRTVTVGEQVGQLRIINSGLKPDDRVVVSGIQRAIPGKKVAPQAATIAQTDTGLAPTPSPTPSPSPSK